MKLLKRILLRKKDRGINPISKIKAKQKRKSRESRFGTSATSDLSWKKKAITDQREIKSLLDTTIADPKKSKKARSGRKENRESISER